MACCVFVAFLISRMIRGVKSVFAPLNGRPDPNAEPVAPAIVSVSGGRFVRAS